MSFPLSWEETPPEVPKKGARVPNNIASFASWVRGKILAGEGAYLDDKYLDWLYDYEALHPAPGGASTFLKVTEEKSRREITAVQKQQNLPEAAAVVHQEGNRLDRVVEALSEGVRELRQGFTQALKEISTAYQNSMSELRQGVGELRQGWTELNSDHRAYLGLHFPHQEKMYQLSNESMTAYRNALLMESKAQAAIAQSQGGDFVSKQADMMMMGLVSDFARAKMGLAPKAPEAEKKPAQPKEEPKAPPAQAKPAAPEAPPMSAPPEFWEQLLKKMTAQEAASVAPVSAPEVEE